MSRRDVYYWKSDRPNAFFALNDKNNIPNELYPDVERLAKSFFQSNYFSLKSTGGQGNHITYKADFEGKQYFFRIENGPEKDDYMEVETGLCSMLNEMGIPAPEIFAMDSSRQNYPFAYQIMEFIDSPDLNKLYKEGNLNVPAIMQQTGRFIARWQDIPTNGFGFFHTKTLREKDCLKGLCTTYAEYFNTNLSRHLDFLVEKEFIDRAKVKQITDIITEHLSLLNIPKGCLVHKDIALWNMLGDTNQIKSIIDWDDTISGDPTDDISLMACFHSGEEILTLIEGYKEVKELPQNFEVRFWLHLLRNMIFKAVIRVGAGYFGQTNSFFLIDTDGDALHNFTLERIELACKGISGRIKIEDL